MTTTNDRDLLVTVSGDTPTDTARVPEKPGSVAAVQYALLAGRPYAMTSDDLLHAAHRARGGEVDRAAFFATPRACLRASPLVKQFGWGIHHDTDGRIALVAMESADYARLLADPAVTKRPGMRRHRARSA
ncbi:DUF6157 family protein [Sphingomonas sp.]|uniref:DUF6157 family protein n=1 Tax=Sphingomonas sp. TaxID=28214 RepID=UPI001EC3797E|nr:DUF6157 family protein [Sphingomonas sp.]MBX3593150.1 hypothetical protein [Sphingomonas sp.]